MSQRAPLRRACGEGEGRPGRGPAGGPGRAEETLGGGSGGVTGGPGRGDSALLLAEGKPGCVLPRRRRLDYVNHARRLAEDDWADVESEEEEGKDAEEEEEEMDVDAGKKLPKRYANQVSSCPPLPAALQLWV